MTAFRSAASRLDRWVFDRRFDVVSLSSGMKCRRGLGKELYVCSFGVWVYRGTVALITMRDFLTSFYLLLRRLFWLSADLSEELLTCREIPWTACRTGISTVYFIVVFAFGNIDFLRNFLPCFRSRRRLVFLFSAYGRNVWADIAVTLCFSAVFRRGTSGLL